MTQNKQREDKGYEADKKFIHGKIKEICAHFGTADNEGLVNEISEDINKILTRDYSTRWWGTGSIENLNKAKRQNFEYWYNPNFNYVQERLLDICNYFDIQMRESMLVEIDEILREIEYALFNYGEDKIRIRTLDNKVEEVEWHKLAVLDDSYVNILNRINLKGGDTDLEDVMVNYAGTFVSAENRYIRLDVYGDIDSYNYMKNEQCLKLFNMLIINTDGELCINFKVFGGERYTTMKKAVSEIFNKSGRLMAMIVLSGKSDDINANRIVQEILYRASKDYKGIELDKSLLSAQWGLSDSLEGGAYENDIKVYMAEGNDFPRAYALSYMDYHTYFTDTSVDFMDSSYFERLGIRILTGCEPVWKMMRNYAKAKARGLTIHERDIQTIENRVRKIMKNKQSNRKGTKHVTTWA